MSTGCELPTLIGLINERMRVKADGNVLFGVRPRSVPAEIRPVGLYTRMLERNFGSHMK